MIELILISSLFSLALYNFSQEDEPLNFLRRLLDLAGMRIAKEDDAWEKVELNEKGENVGYAPREIFYPVLYCAICMGWFYFTLIFAVFNTFVDSWQLIDIFWWGTCAPATSFLNWWLQETLAKALN